MSRRALLATSLWIVVACGGASSEAEDDPSSVGGKADDATSESVELEQGVYFGALLDDEQAEVAALRFDVNDVSYLWPVGGYFFTDPDDAALVRVTGEPTGDLLPTPAIFDRVSEFFDLQLEVPHPWTGIPERPHGITDTLVGEGLADTMRVVSFRFDDCAPGTREGALAHVQLIGFDDGRKLPPAEHTMACAPQLRLVVQGGSNHDAAIHLIYTYVETPSTFAADVAAGGTYIPLDGIGRSIARDLQVLKWLSPESTDGRPLGVHPGMHDPEFREMVGDFVRFYARPAFLSTIAYLSTNDFDGGTDWVMTAMTVDPESDYRRAEDLDLTPLSSLVDEPLSMHFTTFSDDFRFDFDEPEGAATAIRVGLEHTDTDDIVALSNPVLTQVPATDCVSCHRETGAYLELLAADDEATLREILDAPDAYVPPPGMTAFVDPNALQFIDHDGLPSFHNFGHVFSVPTVSIRTAHESADIAASLNLALHGAADGPGLDCEPEARKRLFMDVLRSGSGTPWEPREPWAAMSLEGCRTLGSGE